MRSGWLVAAGVLAWVLWPRTGADDTDNWFIPEDEDEQTIPTAVTFSDGGSVGIGLDWDETGLILSQMPAGSSGDELLVAAHRLAQMKAHSYLWDRWSAGDSVVRRLDEKTHALIWRANDEEDE